MNIIHIIHIIHGNIIHRLNILINLTWHRKVHARGPRAWLVASVAREPLGLLVGYCSE